LLGCGRETNVDPKAPLPTWAEFGLSSLAVIAMLLPTLAEFGRVGTALSGCRQLDAELNLMVGCEIGPRSLNAKNIGGRNAFSRDGLEA